MSVYFYGCITLDGYLAAKDHGLDWLHQTGTAEETDCEAFCSRMDVTLMGRRTFREIERLENELKMISYNLTKGEQLESVLTSTFREIEDITDVHQMTNTQLKRIIQKIEVDKEGNVDIYLRLLGDLGLDSTVLISDNHT